MYILVLVIPLLLVFLLFEAYYYQSEVGLVDDELLILLDCLRGFFLQLLYILFEIRMPFA